MKLLLLIFATICLLLNPTACPGDARKDVVQAFNRFITAFNNLDWNAFRDAFSDDVTVFNPDIAEAPSVGRLDGRQQVEDGFRAVFEATRRQASGPPYMHIAPKDIKIQMLGDTALVSFMFERDGNSIGRRTIAFHLEGRTWKIVHIHASNVVKRG
jgi:ketosteroid isomerase-like protein